MIEYQGYLKFSFIIVCILLAYKLLYRTKSEKIKEDNLSHERTKEIFKTYRWIFWKQRIFKDYPLNIISFRIVPLFVCWIISWFINKEHKSYLLHSFEFPKYWEKYNYEEVISKFFKSMFRLYIEKINKHYEVKFGRDFQNVEIRRSTDTRNFNAPENGLYKDIFSKNDLKHLKIFTWIFPFGLYWNLRRVLLNTRKKVF